MADVAYDPTVAPDPAAWRAADEHARLRAIEDYHHRSALKVPNVRMHAVIHNVVENQLAEGLPEALAAMERLLGAGLSRHDVLHAIGSVVAGQIHAMLAGQAPVDEGDYTRRLQALDPAAWRGSAEKEQPRRARPTPQPGPGLTLPPPRRPRRRH